MIVIIGAGLSGLLTAFRLKKTRIPFKVLEARSRPGGRIFTLSAADRTPVEMGATWFHHEHRLLIDLLKELRLSYFEQYMEGAAYFQPRPGVPAEGFTMPQQAPSYRISGGSDQLILRLLEGLAEEDVLLNEPVTSLDFSEPEITVQARNTFKASKVVLALPPRLWEHKISFTPALSDLMADTARKTQTWMEESMKIALVYKRPFWREMNRSGTLFSNAGPMMEVYDHCDAEVSRYALCGFLDSGFRDLESNERQQLVLKQLSSVFGEAANSIIDYRELNWSSEAFTARSPDLPLFPHQNNGNLLYQNTAYGDRLLFAGTETSPHHGGYMEGAVFASDQVFAQLLR
jgi:monoamine oxidase